MSQLPLAPRAMAPRTTVFISLPIRTSNPSNTSRGNSRTIAIIRSQLDARHRKIAFMLTLHALREAGLSRVDLVPAVVTLTRVSGGKLDAHDGLRSALKRVVDGVADALGVDDGGPFVRWQYDQRKGPPKTYAVEIRIERAP